MNFHTAHARSRQGRSPTARCAFTLPELLVAMTVFMMLVGGIVFAHLYGLSMFRITESKLTATENVRQTMGRMANEIRTCKNTWVGNVNSGVFSALMDGQKQQGTALLINPTTNNANYILYFVNPSDDTFRRTTSTPGSATVLAESITNTVVFSARNYLGTLLTNRPQNRVIRVNLEFYQPRRHLQVADYFKLETAVTRHGSDLP